MEQIGNTLSDAVLSILCVLYHNYDNDFVTLRVHLL